MLGVGARPGSSGLGVMAGSSGAEGQQAAVHQQQVPRRPAAPTFCHLGWEDSFFFPVCLLSFSPPVCLFSVALGVGRELLARSKFPLKMQAGAITSGTPPAVEAWEGQLRYPRYQDCVVRGERERERETGCQEQAASFHPPLHSASLNTDHNTKCDSGLWPPPPPDCPYNRWSGGTRVSLPVTTGLSISTPYGSNIRE